MISIIIPYYNYGRYIQDTVSSICAQTYTDWECIIIDDCSDVENQKVLADTVEDMADTRIMVIGNTVNMGYSFSKNKGIAHASGSLIVHLDADDMLTPNSLYVRREAFRCDPLLEFVHGKAFEVSGGITYEQCLWNACKFKESRGQVHAQTWMVRRDVFDRFGVYVPAMRSKGDKEFLWRLGLCKAKVGNSKGQRSPLVKSKKLDSFVAFYRRHANTMIRYRAKHPEYNKKICDMFAERQETYRIEGITKENTPFLK